MKTNKCKTCGFQICSYCLSHRLPKGSGKEKLKEVAKIRHGGTELAWCTC